MAIHNKTICQVVYRPAIEAEKQQYQGHEIITRIYKYLKFYSQRINSNLLHCLTFMWQCIVINFL